MERRNKAVEEKSARSTLKKVVFSPVQRKLNYQHKIILDNKQNKNVALEYKEFEKYLIHLIIIYPGNIILIILITIKITQTIDSISIFQNTLL